MMSQRDIEHVDVLIVGASISGIGAAHHLQEQCPEKSFLILDAKESYGGTWLQHTYPGARSDSDMFTYGYKFKPWISDPIASRDAILTYLGEVIRDEALERHMLFQHRVIEASWSSDDQAWMVKAACGGDGEVRFFSCSFLWMCSGYYRLSEGHIPQWKGMDEYRGQIVHPQSWPQDLDYRGKRVVVIGSGATAATLIPAMAPDCESLTMLQRSPTYYWTKKNQNELADTLRKLDVPDEWVHEIVRRALLKEGRERFAQADKNPEALKAFLFENVRAHLGDDFDMTHFTPRYQPGQQRLPYLPEGDLFRVIRDGQANIVTDEVERFTETGVLTRSGQLLEADIVISATGFNLNALGDVRFVVDGEAVSITEKCTYRGFMISEVPNMFFMFGYFRTSWTMRVDLVSEFVCRMLKYMASTDAGVVTPVLRECDADMRMVPCDLPLKFPPLGIRAAA